MNKTLLRANIAVPMSVVLLLLMLFSVPCLSVDLLPDAIHRGDMARVRSLLADQPDLKARDADGNTALHWAALNGDARLVKELLKRGASANATNHFGATPLLYAVGNVESVKALLNAGAAASLNTASQFRTTPLIAAARYPKSRDVVRLLLARGPDTRSKTNALREAASAGDLESFKMLLATGAKPRDVITPAMMGHREIVEAALNAGADLNYNGDHAGHALNFALYGHQPAIAKLLIERGADLSFRSPRGEHQTPPILWAAYNESGDASVARAMIEKGVDVNMRSFLGESALDWARARNNKALEQVLLNAGAHEGSAARKHKPIPNRELPADTKALNAVIRQSASRAIEALQRSSEAFLHSGVVKQQSCVSCHQQTLPAVAFAWARERGLRVDDISIARQVQDQVRFWKQGDRIPECYELIRPQPDTAVLLGYGLWGLAALGYPPDALTEAMVWYLAATQRPDGSWPCGDHRPPMEDGPIQGTAFAIRALQLYPLTAREAELKQRIARARDYLHKAKPTTFNQQVFQLLGLGWAGQTAERLRPFNPFIKAIVEKQNADGGWSQLDGLPSDSWATGQALVALNTVGAISVSDDVFQRGARFLLRTQFDDGSWYVRSRAWPFQPHFNSDFPHGKDQWISASGTAWAAMALLLTQPKAENSPAPNWLAIKIPDAEKSRVTKSIEPAVEKHTVDFSRDIAPLLDRSCAACHGGDKKKGRFSITTRDAILKGGQSGEPVLQIGNSAASRLVRMVSDQIEDLEMPPLSKRANYPALTPDEVALLKTWIDEGLPWVTSSP
jgi:ankyrin repeat protein/mono/diheme cytochrome c family protein